MRGKRIKSPKGQDGTYHCIDRIVGGDFLFGNVEKEAFIRIMWEVAEFLSIRVGAYCVMGSHAHKMIETPAVIELSDQQLLEKIRKYKGPTSREARSFEKAMEFPGAALKMQRAKFIRRMGNISEFEKSHKQRFTCWYNKKHNRQGTLWMGRFKSLLVENIQSAKLALSSYIDLNPVRAGIVRDPKDFRFCGYAAALAGDKRCQSGILQLMDLETWQKAASEYRVNLMLKGFIPKPDKRGAINKTLLLETLKKNGSLPFSTLMRLRVRYFTEGLALGSQTFVANVFKRHRRQFGKTRKQTSFPVAEIEDSSLHVLNSIPKNPVC